MAAKDSLHFDVSTGLKRVLGRELITDDEVAIFELVKNSFDAGADIVHLHFGDGRIVIADNGSGMSYEDLTNKWLFVAYSSKRVDKSAEDFRNIAAERRHYAGSKGIGRFSSDRLGEEVVIQSRPEGRAKAVHRLTVDWELFEKDSKEHFEQIPVQYAGQDSFELPSELGKFGSTLKHGTVVTIQRLRRPWPRQRILDLKASLAKLINPFGEEVDGFGIHISAPSEVEEDQRLTRLAAKNGEAPLPKDMVNGQIGNFIFATLQDKTTFIRVTIESDELHTTLTDRGEVIYRIIEPNPYAHLATADFKCEIFYLNQSAKMTFARRIGLPSVQFGSVFLFRNNFRVGPQDMSTNGLTRRRSLDLHQFVLSKLDTPLHDSHVVEKKRSDDGPAGIPVFLPSLPITPGKHESYDHCGEGSDGREPCRNVPQFDPVNRRTACHA